MEHIGFGRVTSFQKMEHGPLGAGEPLFGTPRGCKHFGGSQGGGGGDPPTPLAGENLTPEPKKNSRLVGRVGISHARQCAPNPLPMCIVLDGTGRVLKMDRTVETLPSRLQDARRKTKWLPTAEQLLRPPWKIFWQPTHRPSVHWVASAWVYPAFPGNLECWGG